MKDTYGLGFESAPRTALLFMWSMHMPNAAAQRLKKLKRYLYALMLLEDEHADSMRQVTELEWKRETDCRACRKDSTTGDFSKLLLA